MNKRRNRLLLLAVVIVSGLAAAFCFWGIHRRTAIAAASLPALPSSQNFPAELARRIRNCETRIRDGTDVVAALGELSLLYHANGKYGEASRCYQGLLQIDPSNPRWAHRFATILAVNGQLEDAVMLWRWTVSQAGDFTPACIRLADSLLKLNKPSEAIGIYLKVLKREPENPYALLGMARLDLDAGRWQEARDRLETAVARSDYAVGYDLLVTVCEKQGDKARAEAIRSQHKASGAFFDIPDPWLREIYFDCYDAYQLSVVGGVSVREGDRSTGISLVERAVSLEPNNGYYHLQAANLYQGAGNTAQAIKHLETATVVAPDLSDTWQTLYRLLLSLGRQSEADQVLGTGLVHCPDSAVLHYERGERLLAAGWGEQAIPEFKKAAAILNDDGRPWYTLAKIYFQLGRDEDGLTALKNSLLAEQDFPAALSTLAFYYIASRDEPNARSVMQKVRNQPRVLASDRLKLEEAFQQEFGHAP